jgi:hypothetical protein
VACALHDGLRPSELDAGAESLSHEIVGAADQQESELRLSQRFIELGVAAFLYIEVERVL